MDTHNRHRPSRRMAPLRQPAAVPNWMVFVAGLGLCLVIATLFPQISGIVVQQAGLFAQSATNQLAEDIDGTPPTVSEDPNADRKRLDEARKRARDAAETAKSLNTLDKLVASRRDAEVARDTLRIRLQAEADAEAKKEIEAELKDADAKLKDIRQQIATITAGTTSDAFDSVESEKVDLQNEVESLLRPFVAMMRAATEGTRRIEDLRSSISAAKRKAVIAERAVGRLEALVGQQDKPAAAVSPEVRRLLDEQLTTWRRRSEEIKTQQASLAQQLVLQIEQQAEADDGIGKFLADFIVTRGANLAIGVSVFLLIVVALQFLGKVAGKIQRQRGIPRSFVTRIVTLTHKAMTIVVATLAMLAVFNWLGDWILLGLTCLVVLALAWIGIKMLPSIIEQITLLLNLGAVQEGERVMLDGVPWRVERLDFYTDLANPVLDGGEFTVPVRQLTGLRSRPAAENEAWFPTDRNDWLQLSDGRVGQVIVQTPELVQISELGGARLTFATADFIANVGRNLSDGFRVEIEVGLDYAHQDIATDVVLRDLADFVRVGLEKMIGRAALLNVAVELKQAGASSLDFEVEADVRGSAAARYEDIERELARLAVAACNTHGWTLALPQMVLHDAVVPAMPAQTLTVAKRPDVIPFSKEGPTGDASYAGHAGSRMPDGAADGIAAHPTNLRTASGRSSRDGSSIGTGPERPVAIRRGKQRLASRITEIPSLPAWRNDAAE